MPSAKAIAAGIAKGHTADHPGFWLHVSGTGILTWYDYAHKRWGQPPLPEERYNDVDDIARVTSLPDEALHRVVDKIVLANTSADGPVRTAIIAPPTIYGLGRGPVNTRSIQLYELAKYTLTTARAEGADGIGLYPVVETGKNEWDYVHIADLSRLFVVLVAAVLDPARNSDPEIFGPKGYFFAEAGSYVWGEAARTVAEEAQRQGWVRGIKERKISSKEIDEGSQDKLAAHNSKSVAARARSILGWMPVERTYYDEIPFAVAQEAEQLGLEKLVPGETDELP